MKKRLLTIATRKSPLALWQANWVKNQLELLHPDLTVTLLSMTTEADRMLSIPLSKMGGKGVFVKELEEALLDERADIAVHSMKDVPMELPVGLVLPVMCEREDPRDVFVSNQFESLDDLPLGAMIGTSSLRRQSQLAVLRPDLNMQALRGNVGTRLNRLDANEFSAIVLAAAGLKRLGLEARIRSFLSVEQSVPAAGQGVLGIECRENDVAVHDLIFPLNHRDTQFCVLAERAMCRHLGGGCQLPVAAFAQVQQQTLFMQGLVATEDGSRILRYEGSDSNPDMLGKKAADALLQQGAGDILRAIQSR